MAFSLFNEGKPVAESSSYEANHYLWEKYDPDHILVTAQHGGWVVLNKDEFDLLRFERVHEDNRLFTLLEDKGIIITPRNRERVINQTRTRYSHVWRGTSLHILVPTLRCNHKCVYCHAKSVPPDAKGYDMDEETARAVVDFIFQTPADDLMIEFQGGEPLMNFPIIKFIHQYATEVNKKHRKRVGFIVVTNITEMRPEIWEYFREHNIRICSSLDGPKDLHDHNRIFPEKESSYDEVIRMREVLVKELGNFSTLPTITKGSLGRAKDIIDEYLKQNIPGIMSRNMNFAGFAKQTWDELGYTPDEFIKFWKEFFDYTIEVNKKGIKFVDSKITFILRRILLNERRAFACWGAPCGSLIGQIAYSYDGTIYPCDESRSFDAFRLGNVKTHTYRQVIEENKKYIGVTSCVATMCDNCVYSPYCGICTVFTYGAQGSIIPKLSMDYECKIRKATMETIFKKLIYSEEDRKVLLSWVYNRP